jgi:hypothetical protein
MSHLIEEASTDRDFNDDNIHARVFPRSTSVLTDGKYPLGAFVYTPLAMRALPRATLSGGHDVTVTSDTSTWLHCGRGCWSLRP